MNEKAVLLSIQPRWCDLIASGEKTIEVRKTRPKIETPFKCYIYCTEVKRLPLAEYVEIHRATGGAVDNWHGKVIGEFVCDEIVEIFECYDVHDELPERPREYYLDWDSDDDIPPMACLSVDEIRHYLGTDGVGFAWHISNLKIYDQPKSLSEFGLKRPSQSWRYVEVSGNE